MLWVFVTAESIKYKNRELDQEAARNHRVHVTSLEPEPDVRRRARTDIRARREAGKTSARE